MSDYGAFDDAAQSPASATKSRARQAAKGTPATKKSAAKKRTSKKSSSRPSAAKKTAKASGARRASPATLRRQQLALEEERAQYTVKLEANQSRLASGTAFGGAPLTPAQRAATENIINQQQEKLKELDAQEAQLNVLLDEADPRLVAA